MFSSRPTGTSYILVIEAAIDPLRSAYTALRRAGLEVTHAETAADGLRIAQGRTPALILADVSLPDMSGLDACRRIRADLALASCPVILLSTRDAMVEEQISALDAGVDEYLMRPIADAALVLCVDRLLRAQQAQAILRESGDRLRALVESQGEGIGIVDMTGRFAFANPAAHTIFGVLAGTLVGRSLFEFLDPDQASVVRAQMQRLAQGERSTYELEIGCPNGEKRTLLVTAAPHLNQEGQFVGSFGVFRDVTARVAAERALQEVRDSLEVRVAERAAQLVETNRALLKRTNELALLNRSIQAFGLSLDTQQVLASILDEVRGMFGASACSVWLVDPDRGDLVCVQAAGAGSEVVRGWRLPLGQGIAGWVAQTGQLLKVPDTRLDEQHLGQIDAVVGVLLSSILAVPLQAQGRTVGVLEVLDEKPGYFADVEVTLLEALAASAASAVDNARLYADLERRNQELSALNEVGSIISQSLSREQIARDCLDKVLQLAGLGMGWVQLFDRGEGASWAPIAYRGLVDEAVSELAERGSELEWLEQLTRSGVPVVMTETDQMPHIGIVSLRSLVPYTMTAIPIQAREKVLGMLGLLRPGTRPLESEELQLLTAVGRQMGTAIENIDLLETASEIRMLRELDRMRTELIANASHELRTPLGLIRVFASALLTDEVKLNPDTHRRFLAGIDDEAVKLEGIVDNLLDLSRMESGQLYLDKRDVDLGQLIREATTRMETQGAGHHLVCQLPDGPWMAHVDALRIEQVLRNLLSNAIKYSPAGGTIAIHGWREARANAISVSDQGIGISEEEQAKIFERFHRVDNEATRRTRGFGLGLPICKWIIEAHGGTIEVYSAPGKGSTFCVSLPVSEG